MGAAVPVTARLSKAFYDRFGEDIATELVDWFNLVDSTYRSELKEINELNFARFDAKLDQRLSQLDTKWEQRLTQLDSKWEQRISKLEAKLETGLADVRTYLQLELKEQTRYLFLAWATLLVAILWKG